MTIADQTESIRVDLETLAKSLAAEIEARNYLDAQALALKQVRLIQNLQMFKGKE